VQAFGRIPVFLNGHHFSVPFDFCAGFCDGANCQDEVHELNIAAQNHETN
jgi:hypothetical protein